MIEKKLKYLFLVVAMLVSIRSYSIETCESDTYKVTDGAVFSNYLQIYILPTLFDARKDFIESLNNTERQQLQKIRKDIQHIIDNTKANQPEVLTLLEVLASRWLATELMNLLNKYAYELKPISKNLDREGQMWQSELKMLMTEGTKNEKRIAKKIYILSSPISILALDPSKLNKEASE